MSSKALPIVFTFALFLILAMCYGCGSGNDDDVFSTGTPLPPDNNQAATATSVEYDYTTTITPAASEYIQAASGGIIEVTDSKSLIRDFKLTIPERALSTDTTISLGEVNNPPVPPVGFNYVGTPVDLGPDGLAFSESVTVEISYTDEHLEDAGVSDDAALQLYSYDKQTDTWSEETSFFINTVENKITAEITHFSFLAIVVPNVIPPGNLGTPRPGDLLYHLGKLGSDQPANGWMPGHVGIYTGEKSYPGTGLASEAVREFGVYNVVEALWPRVQYSYYDIPNVTETYESSGILAPFNGADIYMGARELDGISLTPQQREAIVAYVETQVGKPYALLRTVGSAFGMLPGLIVKGPGAFNCVGLAEKAYEVAGVNGGAGLVTLQNELDLITPAEQYSKTRPAGESLPDTEPVTITSIEVGNIDYGSYRFPLTIHLNIPAGNGVRMRRCEFQGDRVGCYPVVHVVSSRQPVVTHSLSYYVPRGQATVTYRVLDDLGNVATKDFQVSWDCCDNPDPFYNVFGIEFVCSALGDEEDMCR